MKDPEDEAFEELSLKQGQWEHTSGWRKKQILETSMTPNTIEFRSTSDNTWVMRITADRKIEVNEDVDVTFAAQKVLDAMQYLLKAQRTERNFCERCGKRTKDIHTCTPPKETT